MNYRIVEKGPFKIVGFKKRVPIIFNGVNPEIAKMTELLTPEVIKKLKALSNVEPTGQEFRIYMPAWCDTAREWDGGVWQLTPG